MTAAKIRRQLDQLRDLLQPPARPVFGSGIVEGGELVTITAAGASYQRRPDEPEDDFRRRVRQAVSAKPLIVFSQPTDPSPPFVIG